ncbi:transcriptional regulator, partial [Klebsiella phage vB_Kpn-VAC111]
ELVIDAFGGIAGTAKELGVSIQVVQQWRKRGMISADGAYLVHKSYRRNNCKGFRASFCRPDLRFDSNGKPVTRRCDRREMLRVVR